SATPSWLRSSGGRTPTCRSHPEMSMTKNGEAMVEVEDLYKAFEGKQVLEGVTCQIPAGKISVVMGPSGTGKSVLLRHLVGLLYPDKVDVRVAGKSVPSLGEE